MPHHIPSYISRAVGPHGIYHSVYDILQTDNHALFRISPDTDLSWTKGNPWGINNNVTSRFQFTGHAEEAVIHLFGETLGTEGGTALGAFGGTIKKPNLTISDSTSVRDVMVLDLPTMATGDISGLYDRQIHTLNALYMKDIHTLPGYKKHWLVDSPTNGKGRAICVVLPRKYRVPPSDDHHDIKRLRTDNEMEVADAAEPEHHPKPITADSFYSPELLDGFDPDVMRFESAKLAQMPLYDLRENLVPPWEQQKTFRKGTFVMVEAHLNIHHFSALGGGTGNNVYQIVASKVRVIGESPNPYNPPIPDTVDIFDELTHAIEETTEGLTTPSSVDEVDDFLEDGIGTLKRHHAK